MGTISANKLGGLALMIAPVGVHIQAGATLLQAVNSSGTSPSVIRPEGAARKGCPFLGGSA